jgi:hypothetical protein
VVRGGGGRGAAGGNGSGRWQKGVEAGGGKREGTEAAARHHRSGRAARQQSGRRERWWASGSEQHRGRWRPGGKPAAREAVAGEGDEGRGPKGAQARAHPCQLERDKTSLLGLHRSARSQTRGPGTPEAKEAAKKRRKKQEQGSARLTGVQDASVPGSCNASSRRFPF